MSTFFSRRTLLKNSAFITGAYLFGLAFHPRLAHAAESPTGKSLIVYFSRTGNTRAVAEQIQRSVEGDLFELRTTHSYPEAYKATTEQARHELDSNFRPQLTAQVANMDAYNVVFIGYPSWWGTLPMAFFTFLESYNFSGKTLVPFCTHEGSGLSRGPADIARLAPGANIVKGFAVRGNAAASAQADVNRWLKALGFM